MPENEPHSTPERAKDEPAKAEYYALGCGCLLTILIFATAIWAGFMRT
jgi:hypothetical protein